MKRRLIVTADDVGLERGMTEGAIRAHRHGIVTACSIVANGVDFEDAVARLRDVPSIEIGVHLTLVEERPLTPMKFPRKYTTFLPRYLARTISIGAIEREMRAQIERVLATGLRITHLNGHQHLHLLPRIFPVVTRLASEYSIPYVRIVDEGGRREAGGSLRSFAVAVLSRMGRRGRTSGLTNDRTIGILSAGHLQNVIPLLNDVDGITELVTHPGVDVTAYSHWRYEWSRETEALCAPTLRAELERRTIELIAPSAAHDGERTGGPLSTL